MTPLRPPRSAAADGAGEGGGGAGSVGGAEIPAGSPAGADDAPEGRLRRLRLAGPAARSGLATVAGRAARAGVSGTGPLAAGAGLRLPLRRRGAVPAAAAAVAAGSWGRRSLTAICRLTLAPTSPSAHRAPSAVWRSTRHTTIEVGAPPTGGRFWVSVQRA
jgi:hypothetical protein